MNPRIEKLREERDRLAAKLNSYQSRMEAPDEQDIDDFEDEPLDEADEQDDEYEIETDDEQQEADVSTENEEK